MADEITLSVLRLIESGKASVADAERLLAGLGKLPAASPAKEAPAPALLALPAPAVPESTLRIARRKWTTDEMEFLREALQDKSNSLVDIAKAMGRTPTALYARITDLAKGAGLQVRDGDYGVVAEWAAAHPVTERSA